MNYIRLLSAAMDKMDADLRITPFHISLYIALFRRWNLNFFNNPLSASRDELMKRSKIGSVNTYSKCLKELDVFGYIKYLPSHNRHRGSQFYMFTFDTTSVQDVRHYINNRNNTNMDKQAKINFDENHKNEKADKNEKSQKPNETEMMSKNELAGYGPGVPPAEEHVRIYFDEKGFPPLEAEKFFNYFQSNGWLVGGRSKMKDWKAAARNWIINAQKFSKNGKHQRNNPPHPKPGKLNATRSKDYSEPL